MVRMARDRNPSGFPSSPIVRPIYGQNEFGIERRVGGQHAGLLRVRRSLTTASMVVAAFAVFVAIVGTWTSAVGIAATMLGPLVLILGGVQLAVLVTRPEQPRTHTDRS